MFHWSPHPTTSQPGFPASLTRCHIRIPAICPLAIHGYSPVLPALSPECIETTHYYDYNFSAFYKFTKLYTHIYRYIYITLSTLEHTVHIAPGYTYTLRVVSPTIQTYILPGTQFTVYNQTASKIYYTKTYYVKFTFFLFDNMI